MPARLRVIEECATIPMGRPKYRLLPENVEYYWSGYRVRPIPDHYASIEDVVNGEPRVFNPVKHFDLRTKLGIIPNWLRHPESTVNIGYWGQSLNRVSPFYVAESNPQTWLQNWPWTTPFSTVQLSNWSMDAFNAFNSQVPTTVSVPNFILELKDLKGMIPSIDRQSVAKTASNNFLSWNFGVMPFKSDVEKMLDLVNSVSKRLKTLRRQQRVVTKLRFDRKFEKDESPFEFYVPFDGDGIPREGSGPNIDRYVIKRNSQTTSFHVGASLYQDLKGLDEAIGTVKAVLASAGFLSPARVVWNAIPYSFLVDWFANVGKRMDMLNIQPFEGIYRVFSVGYSVKTVSSWTMTVRYGGEPYYPIIGDKYLGSIIVKYYERQQGFPVSSLFLTDLSLDPKQMALGLALLEQRRR